MSLFTLHTQETAPAASAAVLAKVEQRYGFIPNLAAFVAESPSALDGLLGMAKAFDESSFDPQEQQTILLATSLLNGCSYCKTAHTALSRKVEMSDADLQALLNFEPLPTERLNTLRDFTKLLFEKRGNLQAEEVEAFLAAGFSKAQVFELVFGLAMKTFTNYANHLADTQPNAEFLAMAEPVLS